MSGQPLIDIGRLSSSVEDASTAPDNLTSYEIYSLEQAKIIAELKNLNQNIEERKKYASYIFSFTCMWCFGLFFFLFFIALGKFHLSDLVITTLIGSTTLNVLVFFRLVTAYLFNKEKST
jgi:hypothetical protein